MGMFFSYPAITLCPVYPESDDEDSTNEYILSPILSVTENDGILFDDDVVTESQHENKNNNKPTNYNWKDVTS